MLVNQSFDEICVFSGVAERTGIHFARNDVRRRPGCCSSVTMLLSKARAAGDGYFYLPLELWPADTDKIQLHRQWVVISSLPGGPPGKA